MDKPKTTPKDFFMWAGAMVAFYWSAVAFLALVFDYVNFSFPPIENDDYLYNGFYTNPYENGVSFEMASLIILFPVFVILMRIIHKDILRDETRSHIWVRRWVIFLTLFAAGATMVGDLVWLLTSFLNGGNVAMQFLAKAATVFLVAAAVFMHFFAELKGYWEQYPARGHMVGYAAGVLVLITIISGFFIIGSPMHARLMRMDVQRVQGLDSLQDQIRFYWQDKGSLPKSTEVIYANVGYTNTDPATGQQYEYTPTGERSYTLCANFDLISNQSYISKAPSRYTPGQGNWNHPAGHYCFDRTIDPGLYPPFKAQ